MPTWANKRTLAVIRTAIWANRRALAVIGAPIVVTALLVFLFVKTQDYGGRQEAGVLAGLVNAKAIDTGWDMAIADARADASTRATVQTADVAIIYAALDATVREIPTRVMRTTVGDLKAAYAEKADLVGRFLQANEDARQALAAAMRADATMGTQVRASWREFAHRERLVAAENLVARTLAEAQAYSRAPTAEHRASLQGYAADLGRSYELPRAVAATLSRLETDVHQLLLLKPLEYTIDARLTALATAGYLDELTALVQRRQSDEAAKRAKYRGYLVLYLILLLVLAAFVAMRAIDHYRALQARNAAIEQELANALRKLEESAGGRPPDAQSQADADVVDIVVKPYLVR